MIWPLPHQNTCSSWYALSQLLVLSVLLGFSFCIFLIFLTSEQRTTNDRTTSFDLLDFRWTKRVARRALDGGRSEAMDVVLHVQPTTYHVQRVLNLSTVDGRSLLAASVGRWTKWNVGRLFHKAQINGLVFLNLRTTRNLLTHNVFF
jgi:hypothetical protein